MSLLKGKKGLIMGVANDRSIAWGISKKLSEHGILLASMGPKRLRLLQEVFFGFRDVIVNGTQKIYIDIFITESFTVLIHKWI